MIAHRPTPLDDGLPEPWACEWGEDEHGRFMGFAVGEVVQRLRWIPPGRFVMGSPDRGKAGRSDDEAGRFDDEKQHNVEISEGFWLGDTPVTQALWQAVMGENPSRFETPDRPVEQVSWDDCQAFVAHLGGLVRGLEPRLPSEAEWEYACRAGTKTATWVGDLDIRGENDAPILDPIAWYGGNSGQGFDLDNGENSSVWPEKQYRDKKAGTHTVRGKLANPLGLYDMLGNVWEWCDDRYGDYLADGDSWDVVRVDPHGAAAGSNRVFRGGSWFSLAGGVRAASRRWGTPDYRNSDLGLRLARGQVRGQAAEPAPRSGALSRAAERPGA